MPLQTIDRLTELIGRGLDLTLDDAREIDALTVQLDYEDACRTLDAVRLIISDPLYKGGVPIDYFDQDSD